MILFTMSHIACICTSIQVNTVRVRIFEGLNFRVNIIEYRISNIKVLGYLYTSLLIQLISLIITIVNSVNLNNPKVIEVHHDNAHPVSFILCIKYISYKR